ncbi:MAG: 16S rRNA (adenine(1518)-N(6)/adenine(1519)-N(6))-dimethyltransferase RsmA [Cyanobacteriota bacterium]|nr:16S rRNA (adenine(1518)-N(6)/adenine(1519)-N(6))-dimethyltransferase RsmA [Cyanobacteriota bacterium]
MASPSPFGAHRARHRFGQHWLVDPGVLRRIVEAAALTADDQVLEVGPGRGVLTEALLASPAAAVTAVELDRDLVEGLRQRFGAEPRLTLLSGDILTLPLPPPGPGGLTKVVANIPYNITGPLLERLLGRLDRPVTPPWSRLVLLVQQEVGERIRAAAGSSAYSALSVRLQLLGHCQAICPVPARAFQPPPRVRSEVIAIDPFPPERRLPPEEAGALERLLRRAFAARRKMLRNSLAGLAPEDTLAPLAEAVGVSLRARPQELSPPQWVALATSLNRANLLGGPAPQRDG